MKMRKLFYVTLAVPAATVMSLAYVSKLFLMILAGMTLCMCGACSSSDDGDEETNEDSLLTEMGITRPVTCVICTGIDERTSYFEYSDGWLKKAVCNDFWGSLGYNPLSLEGHDDTRSWKLTDSKTNSMGYLTHFTIEYTESDGSAYEETIDMEYDNSGYAIKFTDVMTDENVESTKAVYTITRNGGNIMKIEYTEDGTTELCSFTYGLKDKKDNGTFFIEYTHLYNPENMGIALCYAGLLGKPSNLVPTAYHTVLDKNPLDVTLTCDYNSDGLVGTIVSPSHKDYSYTFSYDMYTSRYALNVNSDNRIKSRECKKQTHLFRKSI